MEKQLSRLILTLISTLAIVACEYRFFDPIEVNLDSPSLDKIQSPDAQVTEPHFQSIFETIIQPQCMSCHEPGGRADGVPLETYEDLLNGFEVLVVPGDPEASLFYQVMLPNARRPMPPPRSGLPPVDLNQVEIVRQWIEMGAPLLP